MYRPLQWRAVASVRKLSLTVRKVRPEFSLCKNLRGTRLILQVYTVLKYKFPRRHTPLKS